MKHDNVYANSSHGRPILGPEDLVVSLNDYVRLRELVVDHALAEELDRAIVVPSDRIPKDVVTMNSRLIYSDENAGTMREIELVYPGEADPVSGRISVLAPVGCALLGLSTGQSIDWGLPGGKIHRLRVERVLFQPRPSGTDPQSARTP
jgi:regulator of nucleoside diphosphate kinase